jgi:hypothetical protein
MDSAQEECFWSKVDVKDLQSCWNWTGAKKPSGYGNVRVNKKYLISHRVAFSLANGEIPEGYIVCHICDNPSCCNPSHMMLGKIKSNYCDMLIKNRQQYKKHKAYGSRNAMSKLTEQDVKKIREAYKSGWLNQYGLADLYGVSQPCIGSIVRNKTWSHVL